MGVRVEVQMTGGFDRVSDQIEAAIKQGVSHASERLLALGIERAPMDQGTLMGTGAVVESVEDKGMSQSVVFDTPYAARLHEHPEYNFSKDSNPNAQGKYLEGAAVDNRKELGDIIRKQVLGNG